MKTKRKPVKAGKAKLVKARAKRKAREKPADVLEFAPGTFARIDRRDPNAVNRSGCVNRATDHPLKAAPIAPSRTPWQRFKDFFRGRP